MKPQRLLGSLFHLIPLTELSGKGMNVMRHYLGIPWARLSNVAPHLNVQQLAVHKLHIGNEQPSVRSVLELADT
jgi:hypothetical protein